MAALVEHARDEYPREACGLLLGRAGLVTEAYRGRNLSERRLEYVLDQRDQLAAYRSAHGRKMGVLAYYHSHPARPASPSRLDAARAWGGYLYLILSYVPGPPERYVARLWQAERDQGPMVEVTLETGSAVPG